MAHINMNKNYPKEQFHYFFNALYLLKSGKLKNTIKQANTMRI